MGIVYLLGYFNCILKIDKGHLLLIYSAHTLYWVYLKCMTFNITIIVQKINCGNQNMGREKQDTNYL